MGDNYRQRSNQHTSYALTIEKSWRHSLSIRPASPDWVGITVDGSFAISSIYGVTIN